MYLLMNSKNSSNSSEVDRKLNWDPYIYQRIGNNVDDGILMFISILLACIAKAHIIIIITQRLLISIVISPKGFLFV